MTDRKPTLGSRLRALARIPFDAEQSNAVRGRTALIVMSGLAAFGIGLWWLLAWVLVGLPQAIVTDTWNGRCTASTGIDCTRAIADARQSVLLVAGGAIALVGIVFTYLRWRAERDSTDEALKEGKRAAERHSREFEQLEITRVTDALALLEAPELAKRVAAVSLLGDYALTSEDSRRSRMILDVLTVYVRQEASKRREDSEGRESDELSPLSTATALAIRLMARIAAARRFKAELQYLTLVELDAPGVDWSHTNLDGTTFVRSNLAGSVFGNPVFLNRSITNLKLLDSNINSANFSHVTLYSPTLEGHPGKHHLQNAMVGTDFSNSTWESGTLSNLSIYGAIFTKAHLFGVDFGQVILHQPVWHSVMLVDCQLAEVRMPRGVNFTGVQLEETTLTANQIAQSKGLEGFTRERGRVTRIPSAPSTEVRDSGETPGNSRTPEPSPTDESPT
ncbi:pentapeptide repeat-containing protein [Pseudoclavibacter sp. VKM Ac-2867]|uniref:pentapeptide repeat-containing protein n=1 Tax=Pseudoclavibacter sp. VKM Ac-2867 TaxID=2783829 RepID=UPI00188C3096|nr:pentapeptide repeat-containing protein [Pseudoclavibacter sp. VKM Ac-2867]MBF4459528.1 pentapeptide repeat-containing protein [Pseudoclavibacter sp. VKM Ac-2867]